MTDLMSPEFAAKFLSINGHDLRQQPHSALDWCLAEARAGSLEAQCVVSTLLWTGLSGVRDEVQARYWCTLAAQEGSLDAQCVLAAHQISEPRDTGDAERGLARLERLVSCGHLPAMVSMALLKLAGHVAGVAQNTQDAIDLLLVPAEAGNARAQCFLGMELIRDDRESTQRAGVRWLLRAAEGGNTTAHELLGTYYRDGQHGLPIDLDLADFHARSARPQDT